MQYYFIYTVQNYYEILFAKLKIEYLALLYYIFSASFCVAAYDQPRV